MQLDLESKTEVVINIVENHGFDSSGAVTAMPALSRADLSSPALNICMTISHPPMK